VRIYPKALRSLYKVLLLSTIWLVMAVLPARAQDDLSGTYDCMKVEIAGKTHHCSVPSIELNSDGSYQMLAERGTYEIVANHWLILSTSKNHGKARLGGKQEIIFEFVSGGRKSKITYRRKYQRPPGGYQS
jgi:hypothetical protein